MAYLAECPACGATVSGGEVCNCGYLHVNTDGKVYTRRGEGHNWENAPNISVRLELDPLPKEEEEPEMPTWDAAHPLKLAKKD